MKVSRQAGVAAGLRDHRVGRVGIERGRTWAGAHAAVLGEVRADPRLDFQRRAHDNAVEYATLDQVRDDLLEEERISFRAREDSVLHGDDVGGVADGVVEMTAPRPGRSRSGG